MEVPNLLILTAFGKLLDIGEVPRQISFLVFMHFLVTKLISMIILGSSEA